MNHLRPLIITMIICWSSISLMAQKREAFVVKTDPLSMLAGPFWHENNFPILRADPITGKTGISIEIPLSSVLTLEVGGSYLYESPLVEWEGGERLSKGFDSFGVEGFQIHGKIKFYLIGFRALSKDLREGLYIAPKAAFAKGFIDGGFNLGATKYPGSETIDYDLKLRKYEYGIETGYQFIGDQGFSLEPFLSMNFQTLYGDIDPGNKYFVKEFPDFYDQNAVFIALGANVGFFLGRNNKEKNHKE